MDGLLNLLWRLNLLDLLHGSLHALLGRGGINCLHLVVGLLSLLSRCSLESLVLLHCMLLLLLMPVLTDLLFVLRDLLMAQLKLLFVELTLLFVDLELLWISARLTFEMSSLLLKLLPFNTKMLLLIPETFLKWKLLLLAGMARRHWSHRGRERSFPSRDRSLWGKETDWSRRLCLRGSRNLLRCDWD